MNTVTHFYITAASNENEFYAIAKLQPVTLQLVILIMLLALCVEILSYPGPGHRSRGATCFRYLKMFHLPSKRLIGQLLALLLAVANAVNATAITTTLISIASFTITADANAIGTTAAIITTNDAIAGGSSTATTNTSTTITANDTGTTTATSASITTTIMTADANGTTVAITNTNDATTINTTAADLIYVTVTTNTNDPNCAGNCCCSIITTTTKQQLC